MKRQHLSVACGLAIAAAALWSEPAGAAKNDVDQDGRSDLLLQRISPHHCGPGAGTPNPSHNNAHIVWGVRPGPTNLAFERLHGFDSTIWRVAASGDFDANGLADLYWERMAAEENEFHEVVRVDVKAALTFVEPVRYQAPDQTPGDGAPPASWRVVGSGDFVGSDSTLGAPTLPDGSADLVWQDTATGALALWASDGGRFPRRLRFALPVADAGASAVAVGDLNGDTLQEIVFSAPSGDLSYWTMDGVARAASGAIVPSRPASAHWKVGGAGDFNRDGEDDLVFLHDETYRVAVWYMDGASTGSREDGGWAELDGPDAPVPGHNCDTWMVAGPR
jgi:hypothetical protein